MKDVRMLRTIIDPCVSKEHKAAQLKWFKHTFKEEILRSLIKELKSVLKDDLPEKVYVAWVVECTKFAPPLLDSSWSLKTEISKLDEPWQKTAGYGVVIGTNGLEVSKQIRKFEIQLVHQLGLSMDLDYQYNRIISCDPELLRALGELLSGFWGDDDEKND